MDERQEIGPALMFKAVTLVRNFESRVERLDFGEFTVKRIGPGFNELRAIFSSRDVNQDDWLFEKSYSELPLHPHGSPVGDIPNDVEETLLLLRLYKAGDLSFVKQAIIPPSGNSLVQFPYRAMNDLNSYSRYRFKVGPEDCERWKAFAEPIRRSLSWKSDWFSTARRFFLSGGAKPFNPQWDDLDRITDYSTALESTLVPEKEFNTRRISRRAAALIGQDDRKELEDIGRFIKKLYEIRSRIVHGSTLSDERRKWVYDNQGQLETRIREILRAAVRRLPPGNEDRRMALVELYDITDDDRGAFVVEKFREIKSPDVRISTLASMRKLAGEVE